MSVKSKLDFIREVYNFKIYKEKEDYEVYFAGEYYSYPLKAIIKPNGTIEYSMGGIYNSKREYAPIDVNKLLKLKTFCEMLVKEN